MKNEENGNKKDELKELEAAMTKFRKTFFKNPELNQLQTNYDAFSAKFEQIKCLAAEK